MIDYGAILDIELGHNDPSAKTVRDYLKELLWTVLTQEESFSGKRPFGNSGWLHELLDPIREAGFKWEDDDTFFAELVDALSPDADSA